MANLDTIYFKSKRPQGRRAKGNSASTGGVAAGALAVAMLLPVLAATPAYAAEKSSLLTVEQLSNVSTLQIESANAPAQSKFTSGDLISQVASQLDSDRTVRETTRAAEAAKVAADQAAAEAKIKAEAEAQAAAAKAEEEKKAAEVAAVAQAAVDSSSQAANMLQAASSLNGAAPQTAAAQTGGYAPQAPVAQPVAGGQVAAAPAPQAPAPAVSGSGGQRVIAAALAQLGAQQDCTDLVQNSLAAAGYTTRRDQGGRDMGTGIEQYDGFGTRVSVNALQPGDILMYGYSHVAIYAGNGQAVHGGYNGSNTVLASANVSGAGITGAIRPN